MAPRTVNIVFCVVLLALLCLPVGSQLLSLGRFAQPEALSVQVWPGLPTGLWTAQQYPRRVDEILANTYGLKEQALAIHFNLRSAVGDSSSRSVLIGREGWTFYLRDYALQKSRGSYVAHERLRKQADHLVRLKDRLSQHEGRLVVAVAPNKHTVYATKLPARLSFGPRAFSPNEYDRFVALLAERGVPAVDMRPALMAAAASAQVYEKRDTHWTPRGAVVAFNSVVERAPPLVAVQMPARSHLVQRWRVADLDRMLGISGKRLPIESFAFAPFDEARLSVHRLAMSPHDDQNHPPYRIVTNASGPRILIIGDSFTRTYWPAMLVSQASEVAWIHDRNCKYREDILREMRPELVIYVMVERRLGCD